MLKCSLLVMAAAIGVVLLLAAFRPDSFRMISRDFEAGLAALKTVAEG